MIFRLQGEIWCLCIVTFGPKGPKLNSSRRLTVYHKKKIIDLLSKLKTM